MEPLSLVAALGSEPAKRANEEEGEEVTRHGGAPGARLGAGRNGRSGRVLKEKGTEGLHPRPLSRERARGEKAGQLPEKNSKFQNKTTT